MYYSWKRKTDGLVLKKREKRKLERRGTQNLEVNRKHESSIIIGDDCWMSSVKMVKGK